MNTIELEHLGPDATESDVAMMVRLLRAQGYGMRETVPADVPDDVWQSCIAEL